MSRRLGRGFRTVVLLEKISRALLPSTPRRVCVLSLRLRESLPARLMQFIFQVVFTSSYSIVISIHVCTTDENPFGHFTRPGRLKPHRSGQASSHPLEALLLEEFPGRTSRSQRHPKDSFQARWGIGPFSPG